MTDYLAVYGQGSWGGSGKIHAANPQSEKPLPYRSNETCYTSRCGQRYMHPLLPKGTLFAGVMHLDQCQRCVKLIANEGKQA